MISPFFVLLRLCLCLSTTIAGADSVYTQVFILRFFFKPLFLFWNNSTIVCKWLLCNHTFSTIIIYESYLFYDNQIWILRLFANDYCVIIALFLFLESQTAYTEFGRMLNMHTAMHPQLQVTRTCHNFTWNLSHLHANSLSKSCFPPTTSRTMGQLFHRRFTHLFSRSSKGTSIFSLGWSKRYVPALSITRNCHNLTRISTPGINWVYF